MSAFDDWVKEQADKNHVEFEKAARAIKDLYDPFVKAGFSENQALRIVIRMMVDSLTKEG